MLTTFILLLTPSDISSKRLISSRINTIHSVLVLSLVVSIPGTWDPLHEVNGNGNLRNGNGLMDKLLVAKRVHGVGNGHEIG